MAVNHRNSQGQLKPLRERLWRIERGLIVGLLFLFVVLAFTGVHVYYGLKLW